MISEPPIEVEQRGVIRRLWLNRPRRRNALNEELIEALDAEITEAERSADVDVLVIAGRGPSFCAGADLTTLLAFAQTQRSPLGFLSRVSATFSRLERSRLPVVAAVHGHAVAGGLELALAADVVVAADSTLIGDGHLRNGLLPGGGAAVRLPRRVGPNAARWLMLSGELMPASWFKASGWLHSVVAATDLETEADQVAARLGSPSGHGQARLKPLLADTESAPTAEALRRELEVFAEHWESGAMAAPLQAFFDGRRSPVPSSRFGDSREAR
jgi:enoyl-CoA hydratase